MVERELSSWHLAGRNRRSGWRKTRDLRPSEIEYLAAYLAEVAINQPNPNPEPVAVRSTVTLRLDGLLEAEWKEVAAIPAIQAKSMAFDGMYRLKSTKLCRAMATKEPAHARAT